MTTTTGDSMTGNKTFASAVIGWALVVVLAVGGGAYVYTQAANSNVQIAAVSAQAAQIVTLKAENKATNKRLGVCLGSVAKNRADALEAKGMMDAITIKWGANYRTPVSDFAATFQTLSTSIECS